MKIEEYLINEIKNLSMFVASQQNIDINKSKEYIKKIDEFLNLLKDKEYLEDLEPEYIKMVQLKHKNKENKIKSARLRRLLSNQNIVSNTLINSDYNQGKRIFDRSQINNIDLKIKELEQSLKNKIENHSKISF